MSLQTCYYFSSCKVQKFTAVSDFLEDFRKYRSQVFFGGISLSPPLSTPHTDFEELKLKNEVTRDFSPSNFGNSLYLTFFVSISFCLGYALGI